MERRHGKGRGRTEDVKTERERGGDLYIATNLTAHIHTSRQRGAYWLHKAVILKELYIREDKHNNIGFCQCLKVHTYAPLCHAHTHTHIVCRVCRKLTNDWLCVVCAHSAAPLDILYPPSRKQTSVHPSLSPSICVALSTLFSLSPHFFLLPGDPSCFAVLCCIYYLLYIFSRGLTTDIWGQQCFWLTLAFHIYW